MARTVEEWIGKTDDQRAPPRVKDLRGKIFGMLTVTRLVELRQDAHGRKAIWQCNCDCGETRTIRGTELTRGDATSCGCSSKTSAKDLEGRTFGKWKVLNRCQGSVPTRTYWQCVCECGTTRPVQTNHLRRGKSKSCGCDRPKGAANHNFKHGSDQSVYGIWCNIIQRCENPKCPEYRNYGGRGISICRRWRTDFAAFAADMGPRPEGDFSIDRWPDKNGNYEPGNCRWATRTEQARNSRRNLLVEMDGENVPLVEACERTGINYGAAKWRVHAGYDWRGV